MNRYAMGDRRGPDAGTAQEAAEDGFEFERRHVPVRRGQTIGAALMETGVVELRKGPDGAPRGMYCGIGVCFECVMVVEGMGTVRSCMQVAEPGMRVSRVDP